MMKILCVDIGTGTQDIYLYDARIDIENGLKLVVPSPTMMIHQAIRHATDHGEDLLLTGVTMGGGPSHWATENHLKAGLKVFATPAAARSFNDDLDVIREMGITLVSEDEALGLKQNCTHITLRDFDIGAIGQAFATFGVDLSDLDAVAVAVFDHGNAPPDISDRQYRFDYLDAQIRKHNRLSAFAFHAAQVPEFLTRLQAVVDSAVDLDAELLVMDTAPAAILGATLDPVAQALEEKIIANVGNFHTLAFRLGPGGIEGVFEHHTGLIDTEKLDRLIDALANSSLKHEDVFNDHGHGALVYNPNPLTGNGVQSNTIVTGPRRAMMADSRRKPHFAAPFGDMMVTGCFGLLAAVADLIPAAHEPIHASFRGGGGSGTPPWELS
jgi:uncharacterized protein (DUF1786 family)